MATRNGASTYRRLGCTADLGSIRRADNGRRVFTSAVGVTCRYVEPGRLEVACRCGRTSSLDWREDQGQPLAA